MTRRYFWQIPEFIKYRTVFENAETVLGANENNEHRLFRKDTGVVCFDEKTALRHHLAALATKDLKKLFRRPLQRLAA